MYRKKEREVNKMVNYIGTRKVNATFYTDYERTKIETITTHFTGVGETIDKTRKSINEKVKRYTNSTYVIEVTPISEYFETI